MQLSNKGHHEMVQALAHELCDAAHPDEQITMTGYARLDGEFLQSCAVHKMVAMGLVNSAIEKERLGGN